MASTANAATNGLPSPPTTEKAASIKSPPRVVLAGKTGRILCVADIRGDYHELNRLIREHEATAVIHTGDFGFLNQESLPRMGDKILRHLLQYSPLIPPATRQQLLAIPQTEPRETLLAALNNAFIHFPLSQFPHLLTGAITFPVPVFTVYGLIEDVRILERFRTGEYQVHNLTVIDEACSRLVETSGVKLRLFGLGGALALHKMFDHGEGTANIAGQNGTMWATTLQIGELVETAQRTFDPTETRVLLASTPIGRNGLLQLLSHKLQADITISSGLHFRHHALYNDYAVHGDVEAYRAGLLQAQKSFMEVYSSVKERVDHSMTPGQRTLLQKALTAIETIPKEDDQSWINTWNWILVDASCGHLLLSVNDGRISSEIKSQGQSYGHRAVQTAGPSPATVAAAPHVQGSRAFQDANAAKAGPIARPPGIAAPNKPAPQNAPPVTVPGIKGAPARPTQQSTPAAAVKPPTGPGLATAATTGQNATSIPARPPTQPRQPRAPLAPAGSGKPDGVQSKSPVPPNKPSTPAATSQPNGRAASAAPAGSAKIPEKPKASGTASPAPGKKDTPAANGVNKQDKPEAAKPEEKSKSTIPEKPSEKVTEGAEGAAADDKAESVRPPKKHSLFLKSIPIPTSEDEIKALFDHPDKIGAIKIISDRMTGKQKDFAYVDYDKEEDMKEALANHRSVIRDTTIQVVLSQPPSRFSRFDGTTGMRGGRGGGGGYRGGSGSRGPRGAGAGAGFNGGNGAPKKEAKE